MNKIQWTWIHCIYFENELVWFVLINQQHNFNDKYKYLNEAIENSSWNYTFPLGSPTIYFVQENLRRKRLFPASTPSYHTFLLTVAASIVLWYSSPRFLSLSHISIIFSLLTPIHIYGNSYLTQATWRQKYRRIQNSNATRFVYSYFNSLYLMCYKATV